MLVAIRRIAFSVSVLNLLDRSRQLMSVIKVMETSLLMYNNALQMWLRGILKTTRKLLECFFFQAEDVIRGKLVTGVQTCALPI